MMLPRRRGIMCRATACADEKDTVEIGADELVPGLLGELVQRHAALHAGIVDEDVDRADLSFDPSDGGPHVLSSGHIEAGLVHREAICREGGCGLPESARVAAIEDDLSAGLSKSFCERIADPGR